MQNQQNPQKSGYYSVAYKIKEKNAIGKRMYSVELVFESLLSNGTKEISEELRKRLVAAHQTGKYYKSICKVFGLQRSPFGHTVYKWRKLKMIALLQE